jgi:hypothetical protein
VCACLCLSRERTTQHTSFVGTLPATGRGLNRVRRGARHGGKAETSRATVRDPRCSH